MSISGAKDQNRAGVRSATEKRLRYDLYWHAVQIQRCLVN